MIKFLQAVLACVSVLAAATAAEARTCKPVAFGAYSTSQQTDGRVPLGAATSGAIARQRSINEWRKNVRRTSGARYAVWSLARAKSAVCRTSRGPAGKGGSQLTLECRARAQPCSIL